MWFMYGKVWHAEGCLGGVVDQHGARVEAGDKRRGEAIAKQVFLTERE